MKRHVWALFAFVLSFGAAAHAQESALAPGVWRGEGYGYVFDVTPTGVNVFDSSAAGCVRGPHYTTQQFYGLVGRPAEQDSAHAVLVSSPTRYVMTRLAALPQECVRPLHTNDAATNVEVLTQTFSERYPFFAERNADWAAATAHARARAAAGEDTFQILSELVASLHDGHVTLSAGSRAYHPEWIVAPGIAPDGSAWTANSYLKSFRDYVQSPSGPLGGHITAAANRRVLYGRMEGDIGYIAIAAEFGWSSDLVGTGSIPEQIHTASVAMDQILADLGDVRAIVIDLRMNVGGLDGVALEVASHFADQARIAFRKRVGESGPYDVTLSPSTGRRFSGPVAVLINRNTVSAGETMALAFAALPHVRLFGQPTHGVLSDAIPKTLPNGWTYTMSMESYFTPEGELIEVRGVQPDVVTEAPASAAPEVLWGGELSTAAASLR